jgi:tagatose 1,6-diphosphate aldolase GatY/KbaY
MLTSFAHLLDGSGRGSAVAAFTVYDLESTFGVLRAAAAAEAGIIVLIGEQSFTAQDGRSMAAAIRTVLERSSMPVCLELDHCHDLETMQDALEDGFGAVMADGSDLGYEQNAALVREAVGLARPYGAHVEAELGCVTGSEDIASLADPGTLTDAGQAGQFVTETGAACLAVSIGNVHGTYRRQPTLDWARLEHIRNAVEVPLALHGASGLSRADLTHAIRLGIGKVNVNTELRQAYLAATHAHINGVLDGARLAALHAEQSRHVQDSAGEILRAFSAVAS